MRIIMKKDIRITTVSLVLLLISGCASVYEPPTGSTAAKIKIMSDLPFASFAAVDGEWFNWAGTPKEIIVVSPGRHSFDLVLNYRSRGNAGHLNTEENVPSPGNYILHVKTGEIVGGTHRMKTYLEKVDN